MSSPWPWPWRSSPWLGLEAQVLVNNTTDL